MSGQATLNIRGIDPATVRPTPDKPSGCTCFGIGDTGAHFTTCPWSPRWTQRNAGRLGR